MDDDDVQQAIFQQRILLISNYTGVVSLVLFVYDWMLNLSDEINLVWKNNFRAATWIYFGLRYPFVGYMVWMLPWNWNSDSESLCTGTLYLASVCLVVARASSLAALLARVYAICDRSRRVVVVIMGSMALLCVFSLIAAAAFNSCSDNAVDPRDFLIANSLQVFSRVVFDFTATLLIIFKTFRVLKLQRGMVVFRRKGVAAMLLRHGIFYFLAVTTLDLVSGVIAAVNTPRLVSFTSVFSQISFSASFILVCHFLLDLRRMLSSTSDFHAPSNEHFYPGTIDDPDSPPSRLLFIAASHRSIVEQFGDPPEEEAELRRPSRDLHAHTHTRGPSDVNASAVAGPSGEAEVELR